MIWTGGTSLPCSFVMSPRCRMAGKCRFVMEIGALSISLAQSGTMPFRCAARGKTPIPSNRLPNVISAVISLLCMIVKMRPKLGRISFSQGGAFMPKDRQKSQKTVSTKEYKIGGTRYVVTAHFKSQGSTAIDHIKRMIDNATQNNICRKY